MSRAIVAVASFIEARPMFDHSMAAAKKALQDPEFKAAFDKAGVKLPEGGLPYNKSHDDHSANLGGGYYLAVKQRLGKTFYVELGHKDSNKPIVRVLVTI